MYITPYFLSLDLNDWLDATFWIIPVIFTTLISPVMQIIAGYTQYRKLIQYVMMISSALGCFLFAYIDDVTLKLQISWDNKNLFMIFLGLLAFCLVDVSNEMSMVRRLIFIFLMLYCSLFKIRLLRMTLNSGIF